MGPLTNLCRKVSLEIGYVIDFIKYLKEKEELYWGVQFRTATFSLVSGLRQVNRNISSCLTIATRNVMIPSEISGCASERRIAT